jgi:hypothetical protein
VTAGESALRIGLETSEGAKDMRAVSIENIKEEKLENLRAGKLTMWRLLEGIEGTNHNFSIELFEHATDYFSPRHRHNFEQLRLQIAGETDFGKAGKLTAGMVGYFPEGTPYGPQHASQGAIGLNVQFGSAYISKSRVAIAMKEMSKYGEFKNGAFSWKDKDGGTHNQDSFEALWEHVYGQPLEYAKPRYCDPILMQPANFGWIPSPNEPGTFKKTLGVFTEKQTEVSLLRLDAGARHHAGGGRAYFTLSGEGRAGKDRWIARTTLHLIPDEESDFEAISPSEFLVIRFSGIEFTKNIEHAA